MARDWAVDAVVKVIDGDTVRLRLSFDEPIAMGLRHTVYTSDPKGLSVRLVNLDTPERGQPGYVEARADVMTWLDDHVVRCETYESGGFDRLLGDIYEIGNRGNTLTQWMLQQGWDPWI